MVFSISVPVFAAQKEQPIKVKLCNYVDKSGKWVKEKYLKFDVNPEIIDGRTMVPIRAVAEELGYTVGWNDNNNIGLVTITKNLTQNKKGSMNDYLDKYTQYKDFVYLVRQLDKGKNPTSFKYSDYSHSYDLKYSKGTETTTNILVNIDDILYNCDKTMIEVGFYTKLNTPDKANIKLIGDSGNMRHVQANSFKLDVDPMIVRGRTLLPLRAAGELLGLKVSWDNASRTVTITA
jgi:hypothetical protein